ncbi:hypothetical protein IKK_05009 [Bacillus mycoides]|jgi:predicted  nucleic acid-binding Zn-ribbon protein|nr:hypothetical protein BG05_797 [Bacillus mycoides]RAN73103.1 hypothetical protein B5P40_03635 [Bacillus sp. SRB_8]RAN84480.1 hypothetical protein B5P42_05125 [Bacillus sp. SRB_331]EOO34938.1 hypothetical protein IKK_05009 [Bacillus mycoides]KMQ20028.1 hypothetical protein TU70_06230 [Bacillus mycoides]
MAIKELVKQTTLTGRISRILNDSTELQKEIQRLSKRFDNKNRECEVLKEKCEELSKKLAFYERIHSLKTNK